MKLTLEKIAEFTGGTVRTKREITVKSASLDSRRIGNECLFIALKGENTDGHCYIDQAFCSGCGCRAR